MAALMCALEAAVPERFLRWAADPDSDLDPPCLDHKCPTRGSYKGTSTIACGVLRSMPSSPSVSPCPHPDADLDPDMATKAPAVSLRKANRCINGLPFVAMKSLPESAVSLREVCHKGMNERCVIRV